MTLDHSTAAMPTVCTRPHSDASDSGELCLPPTCLGTVRLRGSYDCISPHVLNLVFTRWCSGISERCDIRAPLATSGQRGVPVGFAPFLSGCSAHL